MESYLELFISELGEYIKQLNKQLLNLEANKKDISSIVEVFRIFHTVKGMSQTMGYESLSQVSHSVEDLLGDAKEKGAVSSQLVDFLFVIADLMAKSAQALKKREALPPVGKILEAIKRIKTGKDMDYVGDETRAEEATEIRIKMEKLDTLFNLTNELTITKSRMLKLSQEIGDVDLLGLSDTAARLISSLQAEVMKLRMLPLSTVFEFFPRWFRDQAKRQAKEVNLEIVGGEIEVDRSIIDVLKEPLLHLLRNALDHGIVAAHHGSKQKGNRVSLRAIREKDRIEISVLDNGKGIDLDEIRKRAVKQGIISGGEAQHLSDEHLLSLLTHAEFSTREHVSTISGRGIGLDIVNSSVVKLGGKLTITSEKGKGSCFTLELPLSVAILRAMIFKLNGQRFALPLNYIQETFYVQEAMLRTVYHRELFPLREEILPLVRLSDRLSCVGTRGRKSVIVVQYEGKRRGFITDEIIDEEEIIVKKLDPLLTMPFYSGCSIYADGLPILILDPRGIE